MEGAELRELGRKVMEPGWSVAAMIGDVDAETLARTSAAYEDGLQPLAVIDTGLKSDIAVKISESLGPIGAKIAPHLSPAQASAWRDAMLMALSDLPGKIALHAVRKAIHQPMQFLNEAEGIIRVIADETISRHRTALRRLRAMQDEIARAASPQQAIAARPDDEPIPLDEIRRMSKTYRDMGLRGGWITQEQLDQIAGEESQLEPGDGCDVSLSGDPAAVRHERYSD